MAVYAILTAPAEGPGRRPHFFLLFLHLILVTCAKLLLQLAPGLSLHLPDLQPPSLHLQRARRCRGAVQVMSPPVQMFRSVVNI